MWSNKSKNTKTLKNKKTENKTKPAWTTHRQHNKRAFQAFSLAQSEINQLQSLWLAPPTQYFQREQNEQQEHLHSLIAFSSNEGNT